MKHQNAENIIKQTLLEKIHENNFLFIDELKKTMTDLIDNQSTIQDKIISLIGPGLIKDIPVLVSNTLPEPITNEINIGAIEEKTSITEFDKIHIQKTCKNLYELQNTIIDLLNKL